MSRPERIQVAKGQSVLLDLNYRYDANGNVEQRNNNIYTYDELDRLDTAEFDGSFLVDVPAQVGYAEQDYFTNLALDYALPDVEVRFDYAASTLGLKFGSTQQVGRIELIPGAIVNSRVGKEGIRLFYRATANGSFTEILPAQWQFQKDVLTGKLILTLKQTINAVEMKIHANYDDRNVEGVTVDESTMKNTLKEIVRVYGRQSRTKIAYEYDAAGNRMSEMYTDFGSNSTVEYDYSYYGGSDRLLTRSSVGVDGYVGNSGNYLDGIYRFGAGDQMGYTYDRAGNLTEKGNRYALVGDSLTFTAEAGTGVHYWKYDYNARNRLSTVWRNDGDVPVARYGYDFSGKRLVVEEDGKRTHYVYNYLGQLLYEDHVTDGQQVSYVYAFGRVLVKVAGKVEVDAELSYYHHDSLGSTMLMTNGAGLQVFKQDYAPFGQTLYEPGTMEAPVQAVQPGFKYTGQREDAGTGLYYYNARYDPETGRFTREDEYQGELGRPQTLNLYVYVLGNPLKYIDPLGNIADTAWDWFSLTTGTASFVWSVKHGDVFGAVVDGAGVLADGVALAIPMLPGGASVGIKVIRGTRAVADVADAVGGVREVSQGLEDGNALQVSLGALQTVAGIGGRLADADIASASKITKVDDIPTSMTDMSKAISGEVAGSLKDILKKSDKANLWGTLEDGTNQGIKHFADYWEKYPDRIPSLAKRLGVEPSDFSQTFEGFENFTNKAFEIATNPNSQIRVVGDKVIYYLDGVENTNKGVAVIVKDGKIQTMMPSDLKSFGKMK